MLPVISSSKWAVLLALLGTEALCAQGRGGAPQAPRTAKAAAPIDLTGYWVSVVTGDWRFRMVTPLKGDFTSLPLNAEARKVANAWDPAKDEAAGEQCRSYGAPALMRVPGRVHITWQDDQTMKLEMDSGTQTRLFFFGVPQTQAGGWQGISKASWEYLPTSGLSANGAFVETGLEGRAGSLKVVTTNLKPGYLRKNGVPYSADAILTEYFDRVTEPNGDTFIIVSTTVEDRAYLTQPFMLSNQFKKQADATGWNPTPCSAR